MMTNYTNDILEEGLNNDVPYKSATPMKQHVYSTAWSIVLFYFFNNIHKCVLYFIFYVTYVPMWLNIFLIHHKAHRKHSQLIFTFLNILQWAPTLTAGNKTMQ